MARNPYQPPLDSFATVRPLFSIWPCRRAAFLGFFVAALLAGLFVPTIELFKGNVSLGRAPVWLAYVGLAAPEYWPLPFLIIAAHWACALLVAWIADRSMDIAMRSRV